MDGLESKLGPPRFVNELGTKFWVDDILVQYAQVGLGLKLTQVFTIEQSDGQRAWVVVYNGCAVHVTRDPTTVTEHLLWMRREQVSREG